LVQQIDQQKKRMNLWPFGAPPTDSWLEGGELFAKGSPPLDCSAAPKVGCWMILPFVPATDDVDAVTLLTSQLMSNASVPFLLHRSDLLHSCLQLFLHITKIVLYVALLFTCIQTSPKH
jgi:hypothetical protein